MHPHGTLPGSEKGLSRAELLASVSLAIDLGLGQPMEHMLRSSLIATRIAERMGLDPRQRETVYYANLIGWIGCHADSHELSALFGDDIAFRADTYAVDMTGLPFLRLTMSHVGRGLPGWERGIRAAAFLVAARGQVATLIHSHCSSAGVLSDRMGLGRAGRKGAGLRLRTLGRPRIAERLSRGGYPGRDPHRSRSRRRRGAPADGWARAREGRSAFRRGSQFSPAVAEVFERDAAAIVDGVLETDVWIAALAQAPDRDRT